MCFGEKLQFHMYKSLSKLFNFKFHRICVLSKLLLRHVLILQLLHKKSQFIIKLPNEDSNVSIFVQDKIIFQSILLSLM